MSSRRRRSKASPISTAGGRVGPPNGGTFVTAITIFERLNIRPLYPFIEQRVAYERLKRGEIDAVVAVKASPSRQKAR